MSGISRPEQARRPHSARFSFRSSILLKQTAFAALVMILTGGTLILAGNEFVRNMVRDQIDQQLVLAASDRQKLLWAYIRQQQERVALVASRTRLRQLIDEFETGEISSEAFQVESKRILVDARNSTEGFLTISITDPQGKVIIATDEMDLGKDYSADPDFLAGREGNHLGLPSLNGGNYRALLTAPATTSDNRLLGVVIVGLDISPMVEFLADTTGLGESGEIWVGTRMGDKVHYLLPPRHDGQIIDVPLDAVPAMANALRGETSFVRTRNYRGVEVLAAYRPVGYRDWGMVAVMDVTEAYAPLLRLRLLLIVLETGLLLIGVAASYLLARHYTQPILEMADKATAVAAGDLGVRVTVRSNDEIGTLAESFNRMTEQLASSYATLEQRILERTTELEAANKELEAFSYSVSHDLRAPLRSIGGFSQALLEDYADSLDAQGKNYLQRVRAATLRMAQLIDDLLELSRVTRGEMRREKVDLSALAKAVAADLQKAQPERQVEFHIADGLVTEADPRLLRVVLENLVENAWKFTFQNLGATIEFGAIQRDGKPVYFLRDDGVGFDMAYAHKLFGAFQRLHAPTEFPGTGIGLATVQRIVHRHGGRVWAEGEVERGATFYFTL